MTKQQEDAIGAPQPRSNIEDSPFGGWEALGDRIAEWETRKDKPFCKEGITLAELAREFGVSRRTLSEYVNTQKGINFNLWINTLRVKESKRLLRMSPDLKLGYASDICGFGTQSAFSKTFRKIEGCTPQEYRDSGIL